MTKIAFISGAAGGLGAAVAQRLAAAGHALWLTDRDAVGLERVAGALGAAVTRVDVVDLGDRQALEALCRRVEGSDAGDLGPAAALAVVNAGVISPGPATALGRDVIDLHLDINLRAAAHLTHALARRMAGSGGGRIVATLSTAAMVALPESAAYAASKFGLRGYLIALAKEMEGAGVSIGCVYPNAIDTPMLRHEAVHGGSALNFLSEPQSVDAVAAVIERASRERKLEYFAPAGDRWTARLGAVLPVTMMRLAGRLERKGEKGRAAFIASRGLRK
ncbi:MAG: SDR family oxidoreductase [Pseudomonadota bacterium]